MSQYFILRQSTSVILPIGPFIDLVAGTAEAALTIAKTEVWLSKNGGAFANKAEGSTATNEMANSGGFYEIKLDTDDTDTPGMLTCSIVDAAADAIPLGFTATVLEEAIYDALYKASATGFNAAGQVALLTATQTQIDDILTDTGTTLDGLIDGLVTSIASILEDTGTTLNTKLDTIDNFLDTEIAAITTEVVTTRGEPAQGTPGATASLGTKVDWLYKMAINKATQTSTQYSLYNSAGAVVDTKSTISDDGSKFTRGALATGP